MEELKGLRGRMEEDGGRKWSKKEKWDKKEERKKEEVKRHYNSWRIKLRLQTVFNSSWRCESNSIMHASRNKTPRCSPSKWKQVEVVVTTS